MNKLDLFKGATEFVVSIGVSAIVGNAIKLTTGPKVKLPKKIAIGIGGIVLSGMVAEMATTYADKKIDEYVDTVKRFSDMVKLSDGAETIVVAPPESKEEEETTTLDFKGIIVNGEITFSTFEEAITIKQEIVELIRQNNVATLRDLYAQSNIDDPLLTAFDADSSNFGWNTVKGFEVLSTAAGYIIRTPIPIALPTTTKD